MNDEALNKMNTEFQRSGTRRRSLVEEKEDRKIKKKRKNKEQCKVFLYLFVIVFFIIFVYIIRPLAKFSALYFLVNIAALDKDQTALGKRVFTDFTAYPYPIVGFFIMLVYPLQYYISPGIGIISIQSSNAQKFISVILIFFECILEIPLTFFYDCNMYSIFLFDEVGIEKLLSPWLIFYPTAFVLSTQEIIRNLLDSVYFVVIGGIQYLDVAYKPYNSSETNIIMIMIALNVFKFGYTMILFFIKIMKECGKCKKVREEEKRLKDLEKKNRGWGGVINKESVEEE